MMVSELLEKLVKIMSEEFGGHDYEVRLGLNDRDLADIGEILISSSNTMDVASIEARR